MSFDWARIRLPEYLIGAGSVALLASMLLLPWYRLTSVVAVPGPHAVILRLGLRTVDGWNGLNHARWLILVTVVVGVATFLLQAARRAPAVPVTMSLVAGVLGGATAAWLIYRVLIEPPGGSRRIGGFVGLLSACLIAYGGYASLRLEGIAPSDAPSDIPTVDAFGGKTAPDAPPPAPDAPPTAGPEEPGHS